ncbi:MAG: glutamate-cysteine ligase family protein [Flavobacteriales bacterium]|nr:glutamate-cysteine ligase family protein [Flavobacteriales bacterium]
MATRITGPRLFDLVEVRTTFAVVDARSLDVVPDGGALAMDAEAPNATTFWRPGAAAHLVELHARGAARRMAPMQRRMDTARRKASESLERNGLCLLPGGCHPWMDPMQAQIDGPRADLADRVLAMRAHGRANGQALRIALSFRGDAEFTRLFAAVRMLLPMVPALTAASPIVNGRPNGMLANRAHAAHGPSGRAPGLEGPVVPEAAFTEEDHYRTINAPLARSLAEAGAMELMGHEWADPRAVTASFDTGMVHLRVADAQESTAAGHAVAEMIVAVVRALVKGRWASSYLQRSWHEHDLTRILEATVRDADEAVIGDANYPVMFGLLGQGGITAGKLWQHIFVDLYDGLSDGTRSHIAHILEHGCLARRVLRHTGPDPDRERLRTVYARLAGHVGGSAPFT